MLKSILGISVTAGLGLIALLNAGSQKQDEQRYEQDTSKYMIRKLDNARSIVEGLATENYDSISKAAQDLTLISHESDWNVVTTENYLRLSSNFRSSTNRLRDSANEKDLDKSTLAYIEVTLNCVRCHQYLRGDRK